MRHSLRAAPCRVCARTFSIPSVSDKLQSVVAVNQKARSDCSELSTRPLPAQSEIRYFECGDRDTEIRAIAKEIKRLILRDGYHLSDIALVVRQRESYAETITRVMREESLALQSGSDAIEANDIPGAARGVEAL